MNDSKSSAKGDDPYPATNPNVISSEKSVLSYDLFTERFNLMKEQVLVKRPVLRNVLKKKGNLTLLNYAHGYTDINLNPTIPKRQNDLLQIVFELAEERYGKDTAWSVLRQLEKYYFVSTADHTGPLTHPFFLNSNLLTAAAIVDAKKRLLNNVIVFSCANISFDNSSYPRGLLFHTNGNGIKTHKLSFLKSNPAPCTIYASPPYEKDQINRLLSQLDDKLAAQEIPPEIHVKMKELIKTVYDRDEIYSCKSYPEQMGKTNAILWKRFFEKSAKKMPNLVCLDMEEIVVKLITKYHLNEDTIINHILFDDDYEHYLNTYFEGIFGSFSRQDQKGTYLFWALPHGKKTNMQLWKKGRYLVSKDESYKIELTPENIRDAMARKELIPGLLLNFITLSFYYGLKCIGGFNQINYLTLMKNAYIKMNVDLENYRSIEICARAQTKEMSADGLSLAILEDSQNNFSLATGIDLILYGNDKSWSNIMDAAKNVTFEEAISPLMPEIYNISYEKSELDQNLQQITDRDILSYTGLQNKIKPVVTI